jgi:hypothetical protein
LFKAVDQNLAVLLVIFGGVMPAVIYLVNAVSDAGALMVVRGAGYLSVFDKPQRDAIAMLLLDLHDHQNTAAEILWGVWLLPLAVLVYRSRFLPRFLGVWLAINDFAYVMIRSAAASVGRREIFPGPRCRRARRAEASHIVGTFAVDKC